MARLSSKIIPDPIDPGALEAAESGAEYDSLVTIEDFDSAVDNYVIMFLSRVVSLAQEGVDAS